MRLDCMINNFPHMYMYVCNVHVPANPTYGEYILQSARIRVYDELGTFSA